MTVTGAPPGASAGEGRLRRLARLADALSDAVTVHEAATAVAAAGAEELEADSVAVCLLSADGSVYDLAASDGVHPDMVEEWASFPADAPVPVVEAVRTRTIVVIDGVEDREQRFPVFGRGPSGSETLVSVPMLVHGRTVIGALSIGFVRRRQLTEVDRAFLQAAGDLCGQAVHRARLFEYQQRAYARQRFLGQAARLLAAELDQDRSLRHVARLAVSELADVCAVCLLDDDGILRPVAAEHRDPAGQQVVDQLVARQPAITNPGLLEIARTGQGVFVPIVGMADQEADAEDDAHLQLIRALGASSAIVVPLRARRRVVGLLLLLQTTASARWDADDMRMAEGLAAHSALALDNARLYAEQVDLVDNLQTALGSHRAIEQAKGMLAARFDITPSEAFERMRHHARTHRRRIQDVADDVVDGRDELHD